jgi:hypothetical protein
MIKATADVSKATEALWALQKATGRPIEEIIRTEMTAVLQLVTDRTRASSLKNLKKAALHRASKWLKGRTPKGAKVTINVKVHPGRAWYVTGEGKANKTKMMNDGIYRWSDEAHADYLQADFSDASTLREKAIAQGLVAKELARLQARRGLAKQSWLFIAEAMGLSIKVPDYVRNAKVEGVDLRSNVSAQVTKSPTRIVYEGRNSSPVTNSPGARGKAAIAAALRGRTKLIRDAIAGKVGHAADAVRRKYGLS